MNHSPVHGIFTKPQEAGSINYPWGHINSYSPRDHLTRTSHETRMILTNQDWVGYAATASRPPTLSGLSLCVCVPHSPSTGLTVLVFLYSWSCSCALRNRWQLLRSRRQERKAKNTQETLLSQTGSDNTHSAPHHWPESVTWPQPNCKGGWEMWRLRWILCWRALVVSPLRVCQ